MLCIFFFNCRTSQNRKVPTFGGTGQSQTRKESNDILSVSSPATKEEEIQTVEEGQEISTSEAVDLQQDVSGDASNISNQDQREHETDERENQEEKDEQRAEAESKDDNLVENAMETETNSYQVSRKRQILLNYTISF